VSTRDDPYRVERRKPLTDKERVELFVSHDGTCCICGGKIRVGERWIDEHVEPLWRSGTNDADNRAPAHLACAREKTRGEATDRAKARRLAAKHLGAHAKKGPAMAGTKRSKWKKKMNGETVRRDE